MSNRRHTARGALQYGRARRHAAGFVAVGREQTTMQMSDLVPEHAELERVFAGCAFAEGPAADAEGNVYFSDCPNNRIMLYRADGATVVWQEPSGRANGMNFDAQGRLVVCCDGKDGGARAVRRYEPDGSVTTL